MIKKFRDKETLSSLNIWHVIHFVVLHLKPNTLLPKFVKEQCWIHN